MSRYVKDRLADYRSKLEAEMSATSPTYETGEAIEGWGQSDEASPGSRWNGQARQRRVLLSAAVVLMVGAGLGALAITAAPDAPAIQSRVASSPQPPDTQLDEPVATTVRASEPLICPEDDAFASMSGRVPYRTPGDWVSFSDAVVTFRAVPSSTDESSSPRWRSVDAVIGEVLWRHPASPPTPQELSFLAPPCVAGGGEFLVPIAFSNNDGWFPVLQATTQISQSDELLPGVELTLESPELDRLPLSEVATLLQNAPRNPDAEASREQDVDGRVRAVFGD